MGGYRGSEGWWRWMEYAEDSERDLQYLPLLFSGKNDVHFADTRGQLLFRTESEESVVLAALGSIVGMLKACRLLFLCPSCASGGFVRHDKENV